MRDRQPPGSFLPQIQKAEAPAPGDGKPRFVLDEGTRVVLSDILAERRNLQWRQAPFLPNCAVLLIEDAVGVARRLVSLLAQELQADCASYDLSEIGLLEAALDRLGAEPGRLTLMHLDLGGLSGTHDRDRVAHLVERTCRMDHVGMLFASTGEEGVDPVLARAFDLVLSLYPVRQ